ncbi:hypothetical protein BKA70DRAFT_1431677 [Coprinopsis sp. MPI-PUGE-AT-0042]|nr:hypothetical protein BKA70DRAFT_1431677 [Coprinopsis sp. MPI-PUGE-AT-0042]
MAAVPLRRLHLDLCEMLANHVASSCSLADMLAFRLVCRNAARSAERFLFSEIVFDSRVGHNIQPLITNYLDLLTTSPHLANCARQLALYPTHRPERIFSLTMAMVIKRLSETGLLRFLTVERRLGLQPPPGLAAHLARLISPLAKDITRLRLHDIVDLPATFYEAFVVLEDLEIMGVKLKPFPTHGTVSFIYKPAIRTLRYSEKGPFTLASPETTTDPALSCLDLSALHEFRCEGTKYFRDVRAFCDIVPLASASLEELVVDVSGLSRALVFGSCVIVISNVHQTDEHFNLHVDVDFPLLPSIRRVYLQSRCSWHTSRHSADCLVGVRKIVNTLCPGSRPLTVRIDVVFRPGSQVARILELDWQLVDDALVALSSRCSSIVVDLRLLNRSVQSTVVEDSPTCFAATTTPLSRFIPKCMQLGCDSTSL